MPNHHTALFKKKHSERVNKIYEAAAKICLKYGSLGNTSGLVYTTWFRIEDYIREFWHGKDYPSVNTFLKTVNVNELKWYIHNKIDINDRIWSSDFLFGLAKHGKIKWNARSFPSFGWDGNENVREVLNTCPFGGKHWKGTRWRYVPAFYLKHSEDSISFMAGLFSAGAIFRKDGICYALYRGRTIEYIEKWKIPIESRTDEYVLISPIWPALFSREMPQEISKKWLGLKKVSRYDEYCPILWKTYVGDFIKGGIPYLQSRRSIFYKHRCEGGAMNKLERMRVEEGLVELDYRIRDIVKIWGMAIKDEK